MRKSRRRHRGLITKLNIGEMLRLDDFFDTFFVCHHNIYMCKNTNTKCNPIRPSNLQLYPRIYDFQAAFFWRQAINGAELLPWKIFTNVVVFSKTNKYFPYKNVSGIFNFICVQVNNLNVGPGFTLLKFTFIQ